MPIYGVAVNSSLMVAEVDLLLFAFTMRIKQSAVPTADIMFIPKQQTASKFEQNPYQEDKYSNGFSLSHILNSVGTGACVNTALCVEGCPLDTMIFNG